MTLGRLLLLLVALSVSNEAFADTPASPENQPAPEATTPPPPAATAPPAATPPSLITTLDELRDKKLITQEEYDRRVADMRLSVGKLAGEAPTIGVRWSTSLFGFVSLGAMWDSTQGQSDVPGNKAISRPELYEGQNSRMTFSIRNSHVGFQLRAPEVWGIRASALLELDATGTETPGASESVLFTSPGIRIFHAALRLNSRFIDVLIGQWWDLFGWQPYIVPAFGQFSGLPAEVTGRVAQIRLSHMWKGKSVSLELAAAMVRPPSRDSGTPEGEGGIRLLINRLPCFHTIAAVATGSDPAAIGVSGTVRRFAEFSMERQANVSAIGWGVSVDAMIPIIPGTQEKHGNALTLTGSYVYGTGIADKYVGLTTGISLPKSNLAHIGTPGLAVIDETGGLQTIQWQSYMVGLQYYFPPSGRVWLSANYTDLSSKNIGNYGVSFLVINHSRSADANLFFDLVPSVRLGLEYLWMDQFYVDGVEVQNHRAQFSAYFFL